MIRPLAERAALLKKACASLADRRDELVETIVKEMGKVRAEAEEEVDGPDDASSQLAEARSPAWRAGAPSADGPAPMAEAQGALG
jgi:acyl-CoA reductase-like NAD-dependent aldehyde dehydrogenase